MSLPTETRWHRGGRSQGPHCPQSPRRPLSWGWAGMRPVAGVLWVTSCRRGVRTQKRSGYRVKRIKAHHPNTRKWTQTPTHAAGRGLDGAWSAWCLRVSRGGLTTAAPGCFLNFHLPHGPRGAWLNARLPHTLCQPLPSVWSLPSTPALALPKRRREWGRHGSRRPAITRPSTGRFRHLRNVRGPRTAPHQLLRAGTHSAPEATPATRPPLPSLRHAAVLTVGDLGNDFF